MSPAGKKTSQVWTYFKSVDGNKIARCVLCEKFIKHFGGTANLKTHLRRMHPNELQNDNNTGTDTSEVEEEVRVMADYSKKIKKRSYVWTYFNQLSGHNAKCKGCSKVLSYKGGSTCNLLRHLKAKNCFEGPHTNTIEFVHEVDPDSENESSLRCSSCCKDIPFENWAEHQKACQSNPLNDRLIESFIEAVRPRPPLWDDNLPRTMRTIGIKHELWQEVYEELDGVIPLEKLEKKWRYLKEMFLKLKKKEGCEQEQWKYFGMLQFLDDNEAREIDTGIENSPRSPRSDSPKGDDTNERELKSDGSATEVLYTMSPAMLTVSSILEKLPLRTRMKAELDILNMVYKLYDQQDKS
ncbi:uncharacterized protein LOC132702248 [Cylas formicarius]|uniref:uncharacterized protein LOC132702248 n=1 Tax=Cylas formicarius TaxID=197179 RepID=UPI00295860B7|nr:uncharacterized protein LOC132702248 [Cylas formicarius]